jgi:hypothetical protein
MSSSWRVGQLTLRHAFVELSDKRLILKEEDNAGDANEETHSQGSSAGDGTNKVIRMMLMEKKRGRRRRRRRKKNQIPDDQR